VPEAELREAMRWQLRDLVPVPPEQLAIDVFHSPPRPNANTARQVYVVAAEQSLIDQQAAVVTEAARRLDAIDIPELALRNIMSLVPGEGSGCALLMLVTASCRS
jgi:MSHA biogenesis protein MshI